MNTIIHLNCIDQQITLSSSPVIASGGVNEDKVLCTFDEMWTGFEKVCIFYRTEDEVYYQILANDACLIPYEVLKTDGYLYIGVFGLKGDVVRTTEVAKYKIEKGAISEDLQQPSEPTPTLFQQLIARMAEVENSVSGKVSKSELAEVATSGSYNDLTDKPTIPDIPTVPTKVSELENDKGYITGYTETDPTVPAYIKAIKESDITRWNNKSDFSGSYNDLTDKPTLPSEIMVDSKLSSTSVNPVQNKVINSALDGKADSSHIHDDRYYTESEIDTKLNGKSDVNHNHDDRYYTESEIDTELSGKADAEHTHVKADITDFAHSHVKADITDFAHNHDDRYYTESEIDEKLSGVVGGGITVTQLWSGSLSATASSSTVYTITNGATYKIITLLMSIGTNLSMTPLTIPISAFATSQSSNYGKWTNSDESNYATYAMWISGNDLKFSGWAGKGTLTYIYGIK